MYLHIHCSHLQNIFQHSKRNFISLCSHVISSIYFSLDKCPSNPQDVCSSLLFSYWTFDVRWAASTSFIQWHFYSLYLLHSQFHLSQIILLLTTQGQCWSLGQTDQVTIQHCFFFEGRGRKIPDFVIKNIPSGLSMIVVVVDWVACSCFKTNNYFSCYSGRYVSRGGSWWSVTLESADIIRGENLACGSGQFCFLG